MSVNVIKPPTKQVPNSLNAINIFLAGSIEMGEAEDWQEIVTKHIQENHDELNINIFNPRRSDWDDSWEQDINNSQFFEQVTWELDHIEKCNTVVVYFEKESKSPITLLELGKVAQMGKDCIVCCPKGFWRKGNVDITCYRHQIPVVETIEELNALLSEKFGGIQKPTMKSEYVKEFPFVAEATEAPLEEEFAEIINLNENPRIAIEEGTENVIYVKNYEFIDNSCYMGKISLLDRENVIMGICTENEESKVKLSLKFHDVIIDETFTLKTISENQEEKIILNTQD